MHLNKCKKSLDVADTPKGGPVKGYSKGGKLDPVGKEDSDVDNDGKVNDRFLS